jgi:putative methyltransferase (TIGR04325 family)
MIHRYGMPLLKKVYRIIRPPPVTWVGDYPLWETAVADCLGYDAQEIVDRAFKATLEVIEGRAKFARDGVTFDTAEYNWQLIAIVQRISRRLERPIHIIDFGGAFGDTFLQNKYLIEDCVASWRVIEQKSMVNRAKQMPLVEKLSFSEPDFTYDMNVDLIILSSVLQYLPNFESIINKLKNLNAHAIMVDRTGFVNQGRLTPRITKQAVRPPIYNATYPCHFFVKNEFLALFKPYLPVAEWNALDSANIPSEYLGIFFERSIK